MLLNTPENEINIEVQQVVHDSRVHIDIETDDIEAESVRLEKLGAHRIKQKSNWLVMQASTGRRFCLVNPERNDFDSPGKSLGVTWKLRWYLSCDLHFHDLEMHLCDPSSEML